MSEPLTNDPPPLEDLLAMAHDEVYAPILLPKEYKRMAAFLASRGVVCPVQVPEVPDARPLPAGDDRDALAALLPCEDPEEPCDADGRDAHRWCDNCIARAAIARAGVTLSRPAPETALDVERLVDDWEIVRRGLPTKAVGPNTTAMIAAAARLDAALAAAQGGDE